MAKGFGPTGVYDPTVDGPWEAHKAKLKAHRARFQPGGDAFEAQEKQKWEILKARPKSREALIQLMKDKFGITDQHEQGRARLRSLLMDYDNSINGNYHYNGQGQKKNVATSDANADWEAMDAGDYAHQDRGFFGRLEDELGIGNWGAKAKNKPELQVAGDYFYDNDGAEGNVYYDKSGWMVDPFSGERVGGNYEDPSSYSGQKRFKGYVPGSTSPGTSGTTGTPTPAGIPPGTPVYGTPGTTGTQGAWSSGGTAPKASGFVSGAPIPGSYNPGPVEKPSAPTTDGPAAFGGPQNKINQPMAYKKKIKPRTDVPYPNMA